MSGALKVLHVGKFYPPRMGGMETHLADLCRVLVKSIDLTVLVANHNPGEDTQVLDGVKVVRAATRVTLASAPVCPSMLSFIRASDADILHIHLPNPNAVLAFLASSFPGRVVFTYHSDTTKQKVLGPLFEPLQRLALSRSSAIIATSPNYLATSPTLKRFHDRCHVIPLSVSPRFFLTPNLTQVSALRDRYGSHIILTAGRLVHYKGFEFLIRAMTRVNATLLIVGDGPLRKFLQNLANECGVASKVQFLGQIDDETLHSCYHACSIFALPSIARSEAFGLVQVEAMAAGKPVINTMLDSGVPFVSIDRRTGITVPPADADALARALNELLGDEYLLKTYGDEAKQRAAAQFSLEVMAKKTLALYGAVTSRTV